MQIVIQHKEKVIEKFHFKQATTSSKIGALCRDWNVSFQMVYHEQQAALYKLQTKKKKAEATSALV